MVWRAEGKRVAGDRRHAGSNGFKQRTPRRSMSLRFRVTSVMPWASAVAASSESTLAKGSRAFIRPQTCATRSSMGSTRSPNDVRISCSQCSSAAARCRFRGRSRSIPCRISPTTRTLRKSSSSRVSRYHAATWRSQRRPLPTSDMMFVSIRYIQSRMIRAVSRDRCISTPSSGADASNALKVLPPLRKR